MITAQHQTNNKRQCLLQLATGCMVNTKSSSLPKLLHHHLSLHFHAPSLLVLLFSKISQIDLLYPAPKPTEKCTATNLPAVFGNPIFHFQNSVFNLGISSNCNPGNVDTAKKYPMPRKRRYVIYDSHED